VLSALLDSVVTTTPDSALLDWLTRGGVVGILALGLLAFLRGWIVPGSAFREIKEERDKALETVYLQAEIARRAMEAAERKVSR
jgi:hypothetical protein